MSWSRERITWKQGSVLAKEDFHKVGLDDSVEADLAVVISHDCDIANDNLEVEPSVEFVFAKVKDEPDGHFTQAKNPRTLHLHYTHKDRAVTLELQAFRKKMVSKEKLIGIDPILTYELSESCKKILQSWLASRYRREALPNSLVERLRPVTKLMKEKGDRRDFFGVISVQLFYDPKEDLQLEEPYEMRIVILYESAISGAEEGAKRFAESIESKLKTNSTKNGEIVLQSCQAVSDAEFTIRDLRDAVEYRLEYLSYRGEPHGPTLSG